MFGKKTNKLKSVLGTSYSTIFSDLVTKSISTLRSVFQKKWNWSLLDPIGPLPTVLNMCKCIRYLDRALVEVVR